MKDFYWLNRDSRTFLKRGYLKEGQEAEDRVREIADTAERILGIEGFSDKFHSYMAKGYYSLATPVWTNFGNDRGLPVSCFNSHVSDTMESILSKSVEVGMMSKMGGGTSGYFGDLRPRGAKISAGGESSGPVHFLEIYDKISEVVSQGCYDNKTEILTSKGWRFFQDVHEDNDVMVAQVGDNDKISFVKPNSFFKYHVDESLLHFKDSKNIDLLVTKNHNMVFKYESKSKKTGLRNVKPTYRTSLAEKCPLHRDVKFVHSSFGEGDNLLSSKERFLIALQADGSITKNTKTAYTFNFTKERKIKRLEAILKSCRYKYAKKTSENGVTSFYVNTGKEFSKKLDWVDLKNISKKWAEEFIIEVLNWDGSFGRLNSGGIYSSIVKENCDTIQSVACFCGYKSKYTYDERSADENKKPIHKIFLSKGQYFGVEKLESKEVRYNGYVYCVEVPSHKLIIRRGGHTLVCGNSARRGSFAAYLPVDHPDVEDFLRIRSSGHSIQNLSFGVTISDDWMQSMIDGDKAKRQVWAKILRKRSETGYPYLFFSDNVNNANPQVYKDKGLVVKSSNLCSEILLSSDELNSFVCILASPNLLHWDEMKKTDAIKCLIYFLDAVNQEFVEKTKNMKYMEAAHNFAKNHRAIGLGALGWHSYLQSKMIAFESMEAKLLNSQIFQEIRKNCDEATEELAKKYGEAPILKGYGRRNTHTMAIAPNTSSSFILGQVSPSIEPLNSNYFVKDLAKGKFTYKNPYLKELLKEKGKDDQTTWKSILTKGGSVQHLDFLSQEEKDVFKTFGEISQKEIVIQAAQRQKSIDQGQSLNVMIPPDAKPKDVSNLLIDGWKMGIKCFYYQRSANPAQELSRNIMACKSCEG